MGITMRSRQRAEVENLTVAELAGKIVLAVEEDGVAVVTINRPEKRNALSLAMWRDLDRVFRELQDRSEIRAVILTGAGGNFCAGADISEFNEVRDGLEAGRAYDATTEATNIAIRDFPLPTIAAISGFAVGGGCGLALSCDFRVASPAARMGIPVARLGIMYTALECELLYRQVGLSDAKRVLYSGRFFGVEECARMHLVDIVAPDALEAALGLAREFVSNAPLSVRGSKFVLEALTAGTAAVRAPEISALIDGTLESSDYLEARRAFQEKRAPVFLGR
jgi:enoyl-CoA hydratase/carnithine racemase